MINVTHNSRPEVRGATAIWTIASQGAPRCGKMARRLAVSAVINLLVVGKARWGLALDQDTCIQILGECGFLPTGPGFGVVVKVGFRGSEPKRATRTSPDKGHYRRLFLASRRCLEVRQICVAEPTLKRHPAHFYLILGGRYLCRAAAFFPHSQDAIQEYARSA